MCNMLRHKDVNNHASCSLGTYTGQHLHINDVNSNLQNSNLTVAKNTQ